MDWTGPEKHGLGPCFTKHGLSPCFTKHGLGPCFTKHGPGPCFIKSIEKCLLSVYLLHIIAYYYYAAISTTTTGDYPLFIDIFTVNPKPDEWVRKLNLNKIMKAFVVVIFFFLS